jgi:DNA-binding MarR family transcriptional regulator
MARVVSPPIGVTTIKLKLSRGASQIYLRLFGVGIESSRCLVRLAIHRSVTAQQVSQIIGMDKASVSRCFKSMQAKRLIIMGLDTADGRVRKATLTRRGRALHHQIREMALERERALVAVLNEVDRETLVRVLRRLHENLPAVERATARYVADRYPRSARRLSRVVDDAVQ